VKRKADSRHAPSLQCTDGGKQVDGNRIFYKLYDIDSRSKCSGWEVRRGHLAPEGGGLVHFLLQQLDLHIQTLVLAAQARPLLHQLPQLQTHEIEGGVGEERGGNMQALVSNTCRYFELKGGGGAPPAAPCKLGGGGAVRISTQELLEHKLVFRRRAWKVGGGGRGS